MKLAQLLKDFVEFDSDFDIEFTGLEEDSRQIKQGNVFVALQGEVEHGLKYAEKAFENGAVAVLYEPSGIDSQLLTKLENRLLIKIAGLNSLFPKIAARYYDYPTKALEIIAITGTNGKTSCSQFLAQCFDNAGIIGTLGWGQWGSLKTTINTTPSALLLQSILAEFRNERKQKVFMEVSSHGLQQGRVEEIVFKGAVFTNLSRDHLDYHGSMEAYFQTKLRLFKSSHLEFAVINMDDDYSGRIVDALNKKVCLWTYSRHLRQQQTVTASEVKHLATGIEFLVHYQENTGLVKSALYGDFNVENLLGVLTTLLALGIGFADAVKRVNNIQAVNGRMQRFGGDSQPLVFVDYAHTPDALEKALITLKQHTQQNLVVVFGCGGDRDIGKRAQMGEVACKWADEVIITDDNPRTESSEKIITDILLGCDDYKVKVINDRKLAVATAITTASSQDCVLIAGKGHENYQEINGIRQFFSDTEQVEQALKIREGLYAL